MYRSDLCLLEQVLLLQGAIHVRGLQRRARDARGCRGARHHLDLRGEGTQNCSFPPPGPQLVVMLRGSIKTSLPAHAWPCPPKYGESSSRELLESQRQAGAGPEAVSLGQSLPSTTAFHQALLASLSPFLLSNQEERRTLVWARKKRVSIPLLCLEGILAVGVCSVSFPAIRLSQAPGGHRRGRTLVPGTLSVPLPARRHPPPAPGRPKPGVAAPSVARPEHGSSRPALALPEGDTKACAARERIMPLR